MNRHIVLHWTAGLPEEPSYLELKDYHFLVAASGNVFKGTHTIQDNDDCTDGKYAEHCGGGNTRAIGIALCGMYGYGTKNYSNKYAVTRIQCEKFFEKCAELLISEGYKEANIQNCFTHKEFGDSHPETTSHGKIDISYLPPYPDIKKSLVGDFIRGKINWYIQKLI